MHHGVALVMSFLKKLTKTARFQSFVTWLLSVFLKFTHLTGRWTYEGRNNVDQALEQGKGSLIYTFWHARLPLMWKGARQPGKVHVLISGHSDGRLIARIMELLGLRVVTGSSSRGGAKAMREMLRLVKAGKKIAITPDGPRGPRMRVQMGTIVLAQITGIPVVPVAFSASRCKFLKSWDRMQIVWPFSRGIYIYGEPMSVPRDAKDLEPYRVQLETRLNALTMDADRRMGHEAILPADPEDAKEKRS